MVSPLSGVALSTVFVITKLASVQDNKASFDVKSVSQIKLGVLTIHR